MIELTLVLMFCYGDLPEFVTLLPFWLKAILRVVCDQLPGCNSSSAAGPIIARTVLLELRVRVGLLVRRKCYLLYSICYLAWRLDPAHGTNRIAYYGGTGGYIACALVTVRWAEVVGLTAS